MECRRISLSTGCQSFGKYVRQYLWGDEIEFLWMVRWIRNFVLHSLVYTVILLFLSWQSSFETSDISHRNATLVINVYNFIWASKRKTFWAICNVYTQFAQKDLKRWMECGWHLEATFFCFTMGYMSRCRSIFVGDEE